MAGRALLPERLDATLDLLLHAAADADLAARVNAAEAAIAEANRKLGRYRALLDNGADLALVTQWIAETTAERTLADRRLVQLRSNQDALDRDQLTPALTAIGGMVGLLRAADRAERARFYQATGLTGTYDPLANKLQVTAHPGGGMVRVGGGT